MNKKGPIIVIEDDADDQHILNQVFEELNIPNEIVFFDDGDKALVYLRRDDVNPFLILSDINMPKLSGFELKKMVQTNADLSRKCIPYLFFTTSANNKSVYDAYTMSVQGYFLKPSAYPELVETIRLMYDYWQVCYSPTSFAE